MQKVVSTYTKGDKNLGTLKNLIENSEVIYLDNKKATKLLQSIGFTKRPIELLDSGFIGNISYNDQHVNISGPLFSTLMEEAESKMLDEIMESQHSCFCFRNLQLLAMCIITKEIHPFKNCKRTSSNRMLTRLFIYACRVVTSSPFSLLRAKTVIILGESLKPFHIPVPIQMTGNVLLEHTCHIMVIIKSYYCDLLSLTIATYYYSDLFNKYQHCDLFCRIKLLL